MIREELERNPALEAEPAQERPEDSGTTPQPSWGIEIADLPIRPRAASQSSLEPDEFDPISRLSAGTTLHDYLRWQRRLRASEKPSRFCRSLTLRALPPAICRNASCCSFATSTLTSARLTVSPT